MSVAVIDSGVDRAVLEDKFRAAGTPIGRIEGAIFHADTPAPLPYDGKQSAQTRRKLFGEICDSSTLLCTAHFPSPSIGRLIGRRDAFDFVTM